MRSRYLMEIQKALNELDILVSFSGRFSQGIIEELGEAVNQYMEQENRPKNDIFNVFSIFIEQTQNIKNYCNSKLQTQSYERIVNSGIIVIGKTDIGTYISSGNLIANEDGQELTNRIEKLLGLGKEELKRLYKEQLKKELHPGSKGAGAGLIDMARKSSEPLEYTLVKVDDQYSFFTLTAVV